MIQSISNICSPLQQVSLAAHKVYVRETINDSMRPAPSEQAFCGREMESEQHTHQVHDRQTSMGGNRGTRKRIAIVSSLKTEKGQFEHLFFFFIDFY